MTLMKPFDYLAAASVDDAVRALASRGDARVLAGGTDLVVQLKSGRREAGLVVDVKRIPELTSITFDDAGLHLGAAAACIHIASHREVRTHYPALAEVAALIGGTAIQGRASIGGNLCNAAPSADAVPLLGSHIGATIGWAVEVGAQTPPPGVGRTRENWETLATAAAIDVTAARALENDRLVVFDLRPEKNA